MEHGIEKKLMLNRKIVLIELLKTYFLDSSHTAQLQQLTVKLLCSTVYTAITIRQLKFQIKKSLPWGRKTTENTKINRGKRRKTYQK